MAKARPGRRELRKLIQRLLQKEDSENALAEIRNYPARKVINPLIASLSTSDETVKRRAVDAIGVIVSNLADEDIEAAHEIMRRFIWSLTEECGAIGWGAPEAMGEIMARHERLAEEYHNILLSYIEPGDNYLEHVLLRRDVLRGIARLAEARPDLVRDSAGLLAPFLNSQDAELRELAAKIADALESQESEAL